ncbi:pimeloyl-ACP methyl ester carboxylesterase [Sphingomonas zeicaulis]|uniref:alpha/beta fold hydrolase n=1 Tax=Sphingomonas zeicaulis TaxID=1632740 RepID=UPI003D26071E
MAGYVDGYWWSNDNLRLHYRDYPGGADGRPPILCIPGLTRNARDFAEVAARLAGDWRVICVDLRGRGESAYARDAMSYVPLTYVQDIERLFEELKVTSYVAFGTSLGGIVTMLLGSTGKEQIAGALFNDVGPVIEPAGSTRIRAYVGKGGSWPTWLHAARSLAETQGAVYPHYQLTDWLAMAKRLYRLTSNGRIVNDYDLKIAEPFHLPGSDAGIDLWPALAPFRTVPSLIVRGALSDVLGEGTLERMATTLPQAETVTIDRIGHTPTLCEPEAVAAIDRLLGRVLAARN